MSTSVTMMLNDNAGATEMPTLLVKAKFHYTDTDTDPTGPGSPTKSVHVVGYELNSTTRTRNGPDTGPTGPARTFFAAKLRWVRAGPVGSV